MGGDVIGNLRVLLSADASSLEDGVKRALKVVQGGVEKMNDTTVDWAGIFAGAVSPAIISGVASMFAMAIEQSMSFQQAMNTTGTAAGLSTDQIAQLGQTSLDMASATGAGAQQVADSMNQVSAIFGTNTEASKAVTQAMVQLSQSGFGDLNEITQVSMDLFKQWGVTTQSQAINVLTSLMHGAQAAKESIPDLAQQFASFTPQLIEGGTKLSSFNTILSAFSATVKDVGAGAAKSMFTDIATGASDASNPMAIFAGGVNNIRAALRDNGGLSVISKLSDVMSTKFGDNVGLIAKNFGIAPTEVEGFINAGKRMPEISTDAKNIATNTMSIVDAFNQSDSALREFQKDWQKLKEMFTSSTIAVVMQDIAKAIGMVIDAEKWILDHASDFYNALTNPFGELQKVLPSIPGMLQNVFSGSTLKNIESGFGGIAGSIQGMFSPQYSQLNSALQGTGVGFSSGSLSRIDQTASQNGLIQSLISALGSGGKGNQYAQTIATFNLSLPTNASGWTPKDLASALYNKFQGSQ